MVRGSAGDLIQSLDKGNTELLRDSRLHFPRPYEPFGASSELDAMDIGRAIEELPAVSEDEREALAGFWSVCFNAPLDSGALTQAMRWCSAASGSWELMFEACGTYKIAGGTIALARAILADTKASLRLNTEVTRVAPTNSGQVEVTDEEGNVLVADEVVVTVPWGALSTIEFGSHRVESKVRLARSGQMSRGMKTWIRVRGEVTPFVLVGGPNDLLNYAQVEYSHEGDTLITAMGPSAATLNPNDLEGMRGQMKRFRPDLDVLAVSGHDWVDDRYSAQTWPMLKTHQLAVLADLQNSVDNVHFAGSDYATGWQGFIDGAIESAYRVSNRIACK